MVIMFLFVIIFSLVKMGFISMIFNIVLIMVVGGFMGWIGIYLDYSKLLIVFVVLGIVVDDMIYMMIWFKLEFEWVGDYWKVFVIIFNEVGCVLVIILVILVCGWLAMLMFIMEVMFWFSVLFFLIIVLVLLVDLFVMFFLIIWV